MLTSLLSRRSQPSKPRTRWLGALATLLLSASVDAFPPAPYHVVYGQIRDEYGNPLNLTTAEVLLESGASTVIKTNIRPQTEPGVNYRLSIPMDAGLTDEAYRPTALNPAVPFKLKVRIGQKVYLPIEMKADYSRLGQPGRKTRLDLTLGEDSDGDGLPDAWERAIIAMLGGKKTLADINPNDDIDGDGLTNLQEYLAGTYAFDSKDGFALNIVRTQDEAPVLEFTAVKGRTYTVLGSVDLKQWSAVSFVVQDPAKPSTAAVGNYAAVDVRLLRVVVAKDPSVAAPPKFFKLMVQ